MNEAPKNLLRKSGRSGRSFSAIVALFGSLPLLWLMARAALDRLSANPIEDITHTTGEWALRFLIICLAVTPLRRVTGWSALAPHRRSFGLLAFGYASLHMLTWAVLDQGLHMPSIKEDVLERPFIWLGGLTFILLLPLAVTSTRGWMKRLKRNWQRLHWLVYAALVLAIAHFYWLVKSDETEPLVYAAIAVVLLGARLKPVLRSAVSRSAPPAGGVPHT